MFFKYGFCFWLYDLFCVRFFCFVDFSLGGNVIILLFLLLFTVKSSFGKVKSCVSGVGVGGIVVVVIRLWECLRIVGCREEVDKGKVFIFFDFLIFCRVLFDTFFRFVF